MSQQDLPNIQDHILGRHWLLSSNVNNLSFITKITFNTTFKDKSAGKPPVCIAHFSTDTYLSD